MMADIELRNIDSTDPLMMRSFSNKQDGGGNDGQYVDTDFGPVYVVFCGMPPNSGKPYIITYHDIGLNYNSNFQPFFNFHEMKLLCQSFSVLNIHAPGQEENALPLPDDYVFPSMDQLAQQVDSVCKFFGVTNFIGLGVGAGANVLSRYALMYPEQVDGLFLIHPTSKQASWGEWFFQRVNIYYLNSSVQGFPQSIQDYLLWHHFGYVNEERNRDLIISYKNYFSGKYHNAKNLAMFINSYIRRTDLNIERDDPQRNFKCSVLVLCGGMSPHEEETVNMNARLDPKNSSWMKLSGCGMVLEEKPYEVAQAFRLFLQGLGYALTAYERRRSLSRQQSSDTTANSGDYDTSKKVHIVENPIAQC